MMGNWELSEDKIKEILDSHKKEIKKTDAIFDIHMSKEDRIKNAKKILKDFKENKQSEGD